MASHSQFEFIGNLTRDAAGRKTGNEFRAIFDLAVDRGVKQAGGPKTKVTDYFRIKCFDVLAENAVRYLGKGSEVFVRGRIEATKIGQGDEARYGVDFIADKIVYLTTKAPEPAAGQ